MKLEVNIEKRYAIAIISLLTVIAIGVYAVYAYGGTQPAVMGHSASEISPPAGCSAGQVLEWSGSAWQCASGTTAETDPTVPSNLKDGVSWGEISGIPAGFADGVDNTGLLLGSTVPASTTCPGYPGGTLLADDLIISNGKVVVKYFAGCTPDNCVGCYEYSRTYDGTTWSSCTSNYIYVGCTA